MYDSKKGPIEHFSWAKFIIRGEEHSKAGDVKKGVGKDVRVIGEKVTKWKEREGHKLSNEMITGVFEKDVEVLIIGIGVDGLIECPDSVKKFIFSKGIKELIFEKTPSACDLYNELYNDGRKVALLAHGTC
jgi:hypothetical protein